MYMSKINGKSKELKRRGGVRVGSGRNPLPEQERRVAIRIYPQRFKVEALGGEEQLREKLNRMVEDMYTNTQKR